MPRDWVPIFAEPNRRPYWEQSAKRETERLERVSRDEALRREVEVTICEHGVRGSAHCHECDPPSAGPRPRCRHSQIAMDCALCVTEAELPPVVAITEADRALWRTFGDARLAAAQALVWRAFREVKPRRALVALSGGKDSTVTAMVVGSVMPSTPVLWTDDELEYPESVRHIERLEREWDLDLTVRLSPATHADWFRPWTNAPYWRDPRPDALPSGGVPTREWQASEGYNLIFTGVRAQESWRRRDHLLVHGPLYRTIHGWVCNPIWDWSADDVWAAIAGLDLPYNPVYDSLAAIGVERDRQRVGPLPLARGRDLEAGWPEIYERLLARYGKHW